LFDRVIVPSQLEAELLYPEPVRLLWANRPPWLVSEPTAFGPILYKARELGLGESAVIQLAERSRANLVLLDDKDGRNAAMERGFLAVGSIGVLEMAAVRRLVDLEWAFARLAEPDSGWWGKRDLLDERLVLFRTLYPDLSGRGVPERLQELGRYLDRDRER
jgi:predicted nucleic acid-binding protein